MRIFSGNANRPLAQAIADAVGVRLGEMTCDRFPDGEVKVQIQEDVRGADVFVVQPTTTNDFLMELLVYPAVYYLWRWHFEVKKMGGIHQEKLVETEALIGG